MLYLVEVKFLPGGSLSPEEFFRRINASWSCLQNVGHDADGSLPRTGICITDLESIEQFTIDISIMPGAGISNIEVQPLPGNVPVPSAGN